MSRAVVAFLCFGISLFTLVTPSPARASKCPIPNLAQALEHADVVFLGQAKSQTPERDTLFVVERVFKGEVPSQVTAHFFGVKYAVLAPPHRYLVFGSVEPDTTSPGAPPLLTVETCSGSEDATRATDDLAKLGAGRAPGKRLVSGVGPADAGAGAEPSPPPSEEAGKSSAPEPADAGPARLPSAREVTTPPRPDPASTPSDAGGCAGCRMDSGGSDANAVLAAFLFVLRCARVRRR